MRLLPLVLLLGVVSSPALAATPEALIAACQPEGAFGQRFGATEMVGDALTPKPDEEMAVAAAPELAPFQRVAASQGLTRRDIVVISATAVLSDTAKAGDMKAALERAVAADGRFSWASAENNDLRAVFDNVEPKQTVASGLRLEIMAIGRWVSVSCVDRARFARAYGDAAGMVLD